MQKAYNECLRWLDKVIDTDATFAVYSNAKEIASIQAGAITLVDADLLEKINETIQITEQEELKEIQKAERLAKRLARKKT
ncbi:hypothetical protein [Caldalkalibacillus mannanilyticus]|uniref:hypothetical protein n=1 Tax=Caldalkalibacillus mannanilyticus TaxID=1418 RepID=UPI0011DCE60C|nr:hypothetical protein [Caldalkalibacillus mannanilyticus]